MMNKNSQSWLEKEADKIFEGIGKECPSKGYVLFQTGFGPSGIPHTGTLCEVIRTKMLMNEFYNKYKIPVKMCCFTDDMDGFRKVPENVPNQELLKKYLDYRISAVPDPFEKYESFAAHNIALLEKFLQQWEIEYELLLASKLYFGGEFNDTLKIFATNATKIIDIVKENISKERLETYSPFMPIYNDIVLQTPVKIIDQETIEYTYKDEKIQSSILNGNCKLQWRADWAMRHYYLQVDYEMHGKDLIESMDIAKKIVKSLGQRPPVTMFYELFLDSEGKKISKSKGNGISLEQWSKYFTKDILKYFIFQKPCTAKKLSLEGTIEYADRYYDEISKYDENEHNSNLSICNILTKDEIKKIQHQISGINFSLLVRLAFLSQAQSVDVLWKLLQRYKKIDKTQYIENLMQNAIQYAKNIHKPEIENYQITDQEFSALKILCFNLKKFDESSTPEQIQNEMYSIGRNHFGNVAKFFSCVYKVTLRSTKGPRLGSFIIMYGIKEFIDKVEKEISNFQ